MTTTVYEKGIRFAIRSAIIGSLIFSLINFIGLLVYKTVVYGYHAYRVTVYFAFAICSIVIAYFPTRIFGGFLSQLLINDFDMDRLNIRGACIKGAMLGAAASIVICIPILLFSHKFVMSSRYDNYLVVKILAVEATIVASLAGAWTGNKIFKYIK